MTLYKFTNAYYSPPNSNNLNTMAVNSTLGYHMIDQSSQCVYVDLEKVVAISVQHGHTALHIMNIGMIAVAEHITEVVALLEGRDALPSKILFGKKDK